jgi:hypothetical protein
MDAAESHYRQIQRLQAKAVIAGRAAWARITPSALSESWLTQAALLAPILSGFQVQAAASGASYVSSSLAEQGEYVAPDGFVDPSGFGGYASDGRPLTGLLYSPVTKAKAAIAGGASVQQALAVGGAALELRMKVTVADAGRAAAGVNIASRNGVGYIRMLNPPSCGRCSILAGKFYRWNAGFNRHPYCDCIHVPANGVEAARSEGLMHDPYEYFHSLGANEQDALFGKAEAKAIRDGADIFQTVNARRGMKPGGLVTTEGTSRRGNYGSGRPPRLTPEAIYAQNLSREQTLRLLQHYGYILPGGQNPLGSILGQREGFGALGRGGTRVGARDAVLRARETGIRDPNVRATMTEAERRVFDSQRNWDAVREGRNPYGRGPLTPELSARAEAAFRKNVLGY